ncbi:hypothetical protein FOQG_08943 [Fusarium oxysporum f. sp. raphani 54005]|uniref:Uncharacterized protein n=1 Tax=Fusarium oxysporum f. sp. raphani 54005 TaxID=1089458 RepID=X0BZJ9_FUSOX|nr:hypothetical protein FOQG_08943 [Fusarium oxysporum f. sp. raphani 54005]
MVRLGLTALLFAGLSAAVQDTEQGTAVTHVPGAYIFEFEENHDTAKFYRTADDKYTTRVKFDYDLFKGVSIQFDDVSTAEDMAARVQIHTTKSTYGSIMWIHIHSIPFHVGFSISISTPRNPFHMFHMWKLWKGMEI